MVRNNNHPYTVFLVFFLLKTNSCTNMTTMSSFTYSGARYSVFPSTLVEIWPFSLSEPVFDNPKSETLARLSWSNKMLVHLKSRWIIAGTVFSCRNSRARAQSKAILSRVPQSNGWIWSFRFLQLWSWRWYSSVPLGIYSNIRILWFWSAQYPSNSTKYGHCNRLRRSTCTIKDYIRLCIYILMLYDKWCAEDYTVLVRKREIFMSLTLQLLLTRFWFASSAGL